MILAWWDDQYGFVPDYAEGIRLFFYTPPSTYGVDDSLNLTLRDMQASFDPWYSYNYSGTWPSAKGLSVKYVQYLKIYPPHRHDFNATGETDEWAYKGGVSLDPPGSIDQPSSLISPTTDIADYDSSYEIISSASNYAAQRFDFAIDTANDKDGPVDNIEKMALTWIGKGYHSTAENGATLYIWNGSGYEELDSTSSDLEVTLTGELSSSLGNYINSGNVTAIVVQKSPGTSLFNKSSLETDYVKLVVTHHHTN
ncbi:MAG: hypothetical protein A4E40_01433 [Methanoregulaceae archaeon PtaU1.Bin059]|jgi:hypothetical protein|nr:MAG: hypothetical protein A4E39_00142 [Methanoregulaceae archaeon PtaB.Bin152]OPY36825.1 MAG: hypothetical protein A4E40_01433 [Methanoregulaceae archaeon PtaU1.Bin059]